MCCGPLQFGLCLSNVDRHFARREHTFAVSHTISKGVFLALLSLTSRPHTLFIA